MKDNYPVYVEERNEIGLNQSSSSPTRQAAFVSVSGNKDCAWGGEGRNFWLD